MTSPVIRILLADDHAMVRDGLKLLIEGQSDMKVVAEASDGVEALALIEATHPDVAVLDVNMPRMNGIELVGELNKRGTKTQTLILTAHEERAYLTRLIQAGGSRCLLKRSAPTELIAAIRAAYQALPYFDPKLLADVADARPAMDPADSVNLSEREIQVVRLIVEGYSNKEIAAKLGVGVKSVETYKVRSMEKLGARSRVDLVRYGVQQGWFKPE